MHADDIAHLFPDRGRQRQRICGRTRGTTDRSVAVDRLWLPIALKTVDPVIVLLGISKAIAAFCRSTDTLPITVLPDLTAETTALFWRGAGRILHANDSSKVATATIEKMGALWSIEEKVRGQRPDVRVAARQEASVAVVADLYTLWQDTLPRISGKSKLAEAIRYALNRREAFEQFLHDGASR